MKNQDRSKVWITIILLTLCLVVFYLMMTGVKSGIPMRLDTAFLPIIAKMKGTFLYHFLYEITILGSTRVLGVGTFLLALWLWLEKRDYAAMAMVIIGYVGGDRLNRFVKSIFERERPSVNAAIDALGYSFPSGHSMVSIIVYVLAGYFITREFKSLNRRRILWGSVVLLILLIGFSRIILRAHFPTDVVGGYALGGAVIIVVLTIYKWLTSKYRQGRPMV